MVNIMIFGIDDKLIKEYTELHQLTQEKSKKNQEINVQFKNYTQYITKQLQIVNDYIHKLTLSYEKDKNFISFILYASQFVINKCNNLTLDLNNTKNKIKYVMSHFDENYIFTIIKNHEVIFRSMDILHFPSDKWILAFVTYNKVVLIVRGETMAEMTYNYNTLRNIFINIKKLSWNGSYELYRLFKYD